MILELLRVARKNPIISIIKSQMRKAKPQVKMKTARSPEAGPSKPNMKIS